MAIIDLSGQCYIFYEDSSAISTVGLGYSARRVRDGRFRWRELAVAPLQAGRVLQLNATRSGTKDRKRKQSFKVVNYHIQFPG